MLFCKSVRLHPSGLRCSPHPSSSHDARPSLRCCTLPDERANRKKCAPTFNITINGPGDVYVISGEAAGQPVAWDAVAISPEAKALLQQHAVKASTALKMHRILGFEDVDDVQRLTPDLIAQLKLQPLQLGPLLTMLQQPQPGADGLHQAHKQQPATALKPLVHSDMGYRAISHDGRIALTANGFYKLEAWDLATGTRIAVMAAGHHGPIWSVDITPDGSKAVSGSYDKTLRVWDLATYRCIATLEGHTDWVMSVAISSDGRTVVSGSRDKTVRVWDLATHACTATLEGHTGMVTCLALTPDGRHAVSGSADSTLRLWDLAAHTCIATMEDDQDFTIGSVLITPDGRYAVSTVSDFTPRTRVWDLSAHLGTVSAAAVEE